MGLVCDNRFLFPTNIILGDFEFLNCVGRIDLTGHILSPPHSYLRPDICYSIGITLWIFSHNNDYHNWYLCEVKLHFTSIPGGMFYDILVVENQMVFITGFGVSFQMLDKNLKCDHRDMSVDHNCIYWNIYCYTFVCLLV